MMYNPSVRSKYIVHAHYSIGPKYYKKFTTVLQGYTTAYLLRIYSLIWPKPSLESVSNYNLTRGRKPCNLHYPKHQLMFSLLR